MEGILLLGVAVLTGVYALAGGGACRQRVETVFGPRASVVEAAEGEMRKFERRVDYQQPGGLPRTLFVQPLGEREHLVGLTDGLGRSVTPVYLIRDTNYEDLMAFLFVAFVEKNSVCNR